MAENVTLARPYAEAAFHLAKAGNALQAWSGVLSRLSAVAATPEMEECIGNPRLSATQVAQLCLDVAASSGKLDLSADQQNFVRVLADNDRSRTQVRLQDSGDRPDRCRTHRWRPHRRWR